MKKFKYTSSSDKSTTEICMITTKETKCEIRQKCWFNVKYTSGDFKTKESFEKILPVVLFDSEIGSASDVAFQLINEYRKDELESIVMELVLIFKFGAGACETTNYYK